MPLYQALLSLPDCGLSSYKTEEKRTFSFLTECPAGTVQGSCGFPRVAESQQLQLKGKKKKGGKLNHFLARFVHLNDLHYFSIGVQWRHERMVKLE